MKFIKKCAVSALCLSLLAGSAASLNIVPASITAPTTITAQAAEARLPLPPASYGTSFYYGNGMFMFNKAGEVAYIGPAYKSKEKDAYFPSEVCYRGAKYTVKEVGYPDAREPLTKYIANVINLYIPETVTKINKCAFYNTGLQTVKFVKADGTNENHTVVNRSNLVTIEEGAFSRCKKLTNFDFQSAKKLQSIGLQGFSYDEALQANITFPARLEYIGDYAFSGCKQLQKFEIDGGLNAYGYLYYVGNGAFKGCPDLMHFNVGKIGRSLSLGKNGNIESVFDTSKRYKTTNYTNSLRIYIKSSSSKYSFGCRFENVTDSKAAKSAKIVIVDGYKIIFRDSDGKEFKPTIVNK